MPTTEATLLHRKHGPACLGGPVPLNIAPHTQAKVGLEWAPADESRRRSKGKLKHGALPFRTSGRSCAIKIALCIPEQICFWIGPVLSSTETVEHLFHTGRTQHENCPEAVRTPECCCAV